jgi:protein-L-isoaspartate(D-aspartate) O-methyltransferase
MPDAVGRRGHANAYSVCGAVGKRVAVDCAVVLACGKPVGCAVGASGQLEPLPQPLDRASVAVGQPGAGQQLADPSAGQRGMPGNGHSTDAQAQDRARMVTLQLQSRGVRDPGTLAALSRVPRERFVPERLRGRAYEDGALAIGGGQTISQPFIVGRSSAALGLDGWNGAHPGERPRVLDVGTGSGYQAAVLADMGADVTSIELDPDLAAAARDRLAKLGYNVQVVGGDGSEGYPPNAPYAGIVVAAASPDVPPPLLAQLAEGGTLVIPVGNRHQQMLTAIRRRGDRFEREDLEHAVFVPLRGRHGFR